VHTIRKVEKPIKPSRRDVLKTSATLMIAVLWGAGPAVTQENKMTNTKKPKTLPSVLTYDDVRAVSPALEYYTKDRYSTVYGSGPICHHGIEASSPCLPSSHVSKRSRCHFTFRWLWTTV
jgi:hypothetical protein